MNSSAGPALTQPQDRSAQDASLDRFAFVFSTCPVALLLVSGDGIIMMTNEELDTLFDFPQGALVGRSVDLLVPESLRQSHARLRSDYLAAPGKRPMGKGRNIFGTTRTGRVVPLELGLEPVTVEARPCVLVTVVDISSHHAIETELTRRTAELEALNTDLKGFARSASHNLKAPLASISGLLSLCIEDIDAGNLVEARAVAANALAISRRGTETIEKVLAIARGMMPGSAETFMPESIIAETWAAVTEGMDNPPRLELDIAETGPLNTDRKYLAIVLANLLSNACRFADPNKPVRDVRVQLQRRGETLEFIVTDNGVGIARANQHRAFQAFTRFHPQSGIGIGLTQSRRAAEAIGGFVTLSSIEGEGSQFTLSIPFRAKVER